MPRSWKLRSCGAFAVLVCLALGGPAQADPAKCQAAIVKASAAFVQARARALHKCEDKVVRGKFPPTTQCPGDARTGFAIAKAAEKMERAISRACGGSDRSCGTEDDESLTEIGWDIGACPSFQGQACPAAITSCADISACLECISGAAVDQAIGLYYDALSESDPKQQRELNRCQAAIGKATTTYLATRSKVLAKCWDAVLEGRATAPCPSPGDGKAQSALDTAELKKSAAICKACGGDDATCGGGDDLVTAEIGFPASCPDVGSCSAGVTDVAGLVQCVDCVTDLDVDCSDLAAVPGLAAYPEACDPPPPPMQLNFSLPPVFGSTALTSGFVPDPFTVGVSSGGPVNVGYLGGGCTGFATSAPTFSVNYTSGAFPTLRFYFIGSGDTTMIINTPGSSYVCVDDSFGTLNPTIDFNNPSSGRYDVWIGSFASGASVGGTLHVTENTGNHP
jgi:hypothetical protein